jgi:hypothetical protein
MTFGFGGLVVSMLAPGTQVRGFKTPAKLSDFSGKKMPSFGGEVKSLVPCRRFVACKRYLIGVKRGSFWQNYRTPFSPTVPPFAATRRARIVGDMEASDGESGNV